MINTKGNYRAFRAFMLISACMATMSITTLESIEPAEINAKGSFKLTEGSCVGCDQGYMSAGFWVCDSRIDTVRKFIDARCHYFNDNRLGLNFGFGMRGISSDFENAIGWNVFYDLRQTKILYHQFGFGLELLGAQYDIRLNSYFPLGQNVNTIKSFKYTYPGGYYAGCIRYKEALKGGDVELKLPFKVMDSGQNANSYFGIGSYFYYQGKNNNIYGGKLRIGFSHLDIFSAEVRMMYDSVFHANVQAVFSIYFDWGAERREAMRTPINDFDRYVIRDEVIVESKQRCKWRTNY